jgi:hypothetical protein
VSDLVLSPDELASLTGYKRPADQLRELHARGFYRARLGKVTRSVILERTHYDTVCAGTGPANQDKYRPQVRLRK